MLNSGMCYNENKLLAIGGYQNAVISDTRNTKNACNKQDFYIFFQNMDAQESESLADKSEESY